MSWFQRIQDAWNHNKSDGYQFGDLTVSLFGGKRDTKYNGYDPLSFGSSTSSPSSVVNEISLDSRKQFLEDRQHTEDREDSVYQRGVEDMRKAGLNPYTIGANPSPSSSSSVGENQIMAKLQILGYLLDIQNLDIKNKSLLNGVLGNIIKMWS